jgi:hypothetical protein
LKKDRSPPGPLFPVRRGEGRGAWRTAATSTLSPRVAVAVASDGQLISADEDEREHVGWWDEKVQDAGRKWDDSNCIPDDTILSADDAARETGIGIRAVSR